MSASEPMAVVAPNFSSGPITTAAHVPAVSTPNHPGSESDEEMPLARKVVANGPRKRVGTSDSEDEKPLSKKPRPSNGPMKKRRIVESDSESEEDSKAGPSSSPIVAKPEPQPTPKANGAPKPPPRKPSSDSDLSSEDDKPLAKKHVATNGNGVAKSKPTPTPAAAPVPALLPKAAPKPKPKVKPESESDEDSSFSESSEDEKPLAKVKAKPAAAPPVKPRKSSTSAPVKKPKPEPESESEDEKPLAKAKKPKGKDVKVKDEKPTVKRVKKEAKDEDGDDQFKWWEEGDALGDGSVKWQTFHHNGVLFPPPYIPLPKGVKMKYDGVPLTLPPESEEVAGFFGAMLETDHAQDEVFRANFFRDFKAMLDQFPPKEGVKVKSLEKCDFKPMLEHFEREKERKKAMTKDEKKKIKDDKTKMEEPYVFATIDGRKEKAGNFRAEPPGLFRGRGEHPRKGTLKLRLRPEDIILNLSEDAPVPIPNIPGKWKGIQHDNTVTWLAHWKENVNGQAKYVFLSAASTWKGQSDRAKFEKARELINHVDKIRKDYSEDLKSKIMADRQRATALYFIDRLALRAGNEKGEDEADTVGCCSLRYEHVTLEPPNKVIFDFLGKDSMRFHQEVEVEAQVFKNIKIFKADPKQKGDDLFDRLTTSLLNKHLNSQMAGLTAKVFRTYNASWTFQQQLKHTPKNGTVAEKIAAYNTANREVAILCNHQKTVSKGFAESFAKMGDKVRALKYQRMKLRLQLFTMDPKLKKKHPELVEDESDMDDEFMERHESELLEKAIEAAKKKFDKENAKLKEEKQDKKPKSELDDRIKEIKSEFKELAKERKTKKVEPRRATTEEKLLENIKKMDERIATAKIQMGDRDKLKDVALGTSKINYIDPRITVAWAAKYEVPLEKLFSKTLREKFPWAEAEADAKWRF